MDFWVLGAAFHTGLGAVLYLAAPSMMLSFDGGMGVVINELLVMPAAIPLNALLLSSTGRSLGKWLFALKVEPTDGQAINLRRAAMRELDTLLWGLCAGWAISWAPLRSGDSIARGGTTTWDRLHRTRVLRRPLGWARWSLGLGIAVILTAGVVWLQTYVWQKVWETLF